MSYKKLQVITLCTGNFKEATKVVQVPLVEPTADQIRVRQIYGGVNAVDMGVAKGRIFTDGKVPYGIGLEGLGVVDAVGAQAAKNSKFTVGQNVLVVDWDSPQGFSEYCYTTPDKLFPVPDLNPKYLVAGINALTSVIGLEIAGQIKSGSKVLVTAPSGGTGQIAVQWAKSKGCYVIGLTSTKEKSDYIKKEFGVDHVINYREQKLDQALSEQFPKGIDLIWETIGGETFKTLFAHLAFGGRMVLVGNISDSKKGPGAEPTVIPNINSPLIHQSKSLVGFNLCAGADHIPTYSPKIIAGIADGKIKAKVDIGGQGSGNEGGEFVGLDQIYRAQEWLQSGNSIGKVIVKIQNE